MQVTEYHSKEATPNSVQQEQKSSARILLIDDNPDDRVLITRELRRLPVQVVEVLDQHTLERELKHDDISLVITDYHFFWSNGLLVLDHIKKTHPDVPVIMFTGTGNEEVAVEAMKRGLHDYVLKSPRHFTRLRSSVQVALRARAERCQAAQAEARYKMLFDTVPVGLFRCTPTGKVLDANPALAAILGYSDRKELLENNFTSFHPNWSDFQSWRDQLEREGSVAFIEARFRTQGGETRWVEIHARTLRDVETGQIYYEGSVEDITARKMAQAEREKLIEDLRAALTRVKTLTGLLPICASCKKIRDEKGTWNDLECFIEGHSQAHFTHSFCPDCVQRLYPEVFLDIPKI